MQHVLKVLFAGLMLTSLFGTTQAHHSRSNFDNSRTVTVEGVVTEFSWSNPHIYIEVVAGDNEVWLVEANSVTSMRRRGWNEETLKPGERVTFIGNPDKDSSKNFMVMTRLEKGDGKLIEHRSQTSNAPVTPSTDFSGIWHMDMRNFDVHAAGGPPPTDWPYTELGAQMAASYDPEDSPELECKQIGVPRMMVYPYNIGFTRTADSLNVFKEHLNERRTIWFDPAKAKMAAERPSPTGTSVVSEMTQTRLVIVTDNFAPTEWGIENSLDSSDQKRVEEVFMLSEDGLRLDVEMSITDPVLFTAPVLRKISFVKQPDIELAEIACDPRAADRHMTLDMTGSKVGNDPLATLKLPDTAANDDASKDKPWWRFWE